MFDWQSIEASFKAMEAVPVVPCAKAADVIRDFFKTRGIDVVVDHRAIQKTPSMIREISAQRLISDALIDAMVPKVGPQILFHYTKIGGLRSISKNGYLRLSRLTDVLGNDEYTTFANAHGLVGIHSKTGQGNTILEEIAETLFYASFAIPGSHDAAQLWQEQGGGGAGVRLRLHATPHAALFKRMEYDCGQPTLLHDLNNELRCEVGVPFVPHGISRLAAFYLPASYAFEGEVRLLQPAHKDYKGSELVEDNGKRYLKAAFADNKICDLKGLAIEYGSNAREDTVEKAIANTSLQGMQIVAAVGNA
ncbi:hypothetical protein RQ734_21985 [Roseomonas mucosa]|uniref:hypothetical protein n=1 Tax=Roseomonas mucosa TaxID=207340 RepID=UPI0028CD906D|nr:hypothetical protein [Roseomonas mucosa]MDT8278731.1 hypothetical protein [Roseomonas mucosa]